MIIPNGTIEFWNVTSEGGLDSTTGYPIASTGTWGNPINCQYRYTTHDNLAKSDGEPIISKHFTIWIDPIYGIPPERIRLKDRYGATLGEFSVISATPLVAVAQYEIIV